MSRVNIAVAVAVFVPALALGCGGATGNGLVPSQTLSEPGGSLAATSIPAASGVGTRSAEPPFNLEAILRGDGFGHVTFRQDKDPTHNIVDLDVWVRDLAPNASYNLQRAVDTTLDEVCTGTNWLTLGQGPVPQAIVTDDRGTGRASLWRDLSAFAPGTSFDIHFRVILSGTSSVVLQSDCYRFVIRD